MKKPITMFGVGMHPWTMTETVAGIASRLDSGTFTQHVVVNVAKLVNMQKDRQLLASVQECDIVNIDGAGVVLAGRLLGFDIPERVAGIGLFMRLLQLAEERGEKVFFWVLQNKWWKRLLRKSARFIPACRSPAGITAISGARSVWSCKRSAAQAPRCCSWHCLRQKRRILSVAGKRTCMSSSSWGSAAASMS